jgi:hypothetical protein
MDPDLAVRMNSLKFGDVHAIVGDEIQLVWWAKNNNLTYQVEFPIGADQEIAFYFRKDKSSAPPTPTRPTPPTPVIVMDSRFKCTMSSNDMNSRKGSCRKSCPSVGFFFRCKNCYSMPSCMFQLGSGIAGSCCDDEKYCCSKSCTRNQFGRNQCLCNSHGRKECSIHCSTIYNPRIHYNVLDTQTNKQVASFGSNGFYSSHSCSTSISCANTYTKQFQVGQTIPCNVNLQTGVVQSHEIERPVVLSSAPMVSPSMITIMMIIAVMAFGF